MDEFMRLVEALKEIPGADTFGHDSSPEGTERDRRYVFQIEFFAGPDARGRAMNYMREQILAAGRSLPEGTSNR